MSNKKDLFSKFKCPKQDDEILLLTHTDLDGSGPVLLLKCIFKNLTIRHCSNKEMSWCIKNAVCNPMVSKEYNTIFACDISCSKDDAIKIQNNPNHNKLIILDHHASASYLNVYTWACIEPNLIDDSYRKKLYPENANGLSSGTSLMYDFLDYNNLINNIPNLKLTQQLVQMIAAWDTWDWSNIFGKDKSYTYLDILFDMYGMIYLEQKIFDKINDASCTNIFDETDNMFLNIAETKIQTYLKSIQHGIKTGNLCINQKMYSCVFCAANEYMADVFDCMEELYPDYALYFINYGTGLSFRTTNSDINVGQILAPLGGGGHPGAGGIKIAFDTQQSAIEKTLQSTLYVD